MNATRKVIGIDFGSSQSSVAIMEIGTTDPPELFTFDDSSVGEPMQTVLLLDENDETPIAIGNKVKAQADATSPIGCKFVSDFKRQLGTGGTEGKNAERYAEWFLKELKEQIERHEARELSSKRYATCIACPAGWNDEQVQLLRKLVEDAGFPSDPTRGVYVLEEPVAALRAHPINYGANPEYFLVMDFGGGTLDICVVETDIGGQAPIVKGKGGDPMLGGRDFDLLLIHHLELVHKEKGLNYASLSSFDQYKLDAQIRDAKRFLSDNFVGRKDQDSVSARVKWPNCGEVSLTLSPGEFKNMVRTKTIDRRIHGRKDGDSVSARGKRPNCGEVSSTLSPREAKNTVKAKTIDERIRSSIREAIIDSGVPLDKITRAVLTGGSALWFFVRDIVCEECQLVNDEKTVVVSKTPFTDVAMGCALSTGRIGGADGRDGLWVKWRFDGETHWHGPKELLRTGRKQAEPGIKHQHLCVVPKSRLLQPYRVELLFLEGEEGGLLPYKEGVKSRAMVDFYARSNHPILKRPMDTLNVIRGRLNQLDLTFQDTYHCFLHCREYPNRTVDFKLELRDWAESKGADTSFSWDDDNLIDVELGKLSRCGCFGKGLRKSVPLKSVELAPPDLDEASALPSGRSFLKRLRLPKFHRKAE